MQFLFGKSILGDIHLTMASLRNGCGPIMDALDIILFKRVAVRTSSHGASSRNSFWIFMGAEADNIDDIMIVDPWFVPVQNIIWVSNVLQNDPERISKIRSVVLYTFKWQSFSQTRWAGVGPSCRIYLMSKAVGVDFYAKEAFADKHLSHEKLAGYPKYSTLEVNKYAAIMSLATYPAETFTLDLMEDDRFVRRAAELKSEINDEIRVLEAIPMPVWCLIARLVGCSMFGGTALSDMVFFVTYTTLAFLDHNCFELLRQLPLSLTQGDIAFNVAEFAKLTFNHDWKPLTQRIWHCCHVLSVDVVVHHLTLLLDVPMTTQMNEKAHAASAIVRRYHSRLGVRVMQRRALLADIIPLFRMSHESRIEAELQKELSATVDGKVKSK
jgi:hypothetical protein